MLQAVKNAFGVGYDSQKNRGEISPNYIMYQGQKNVIDAFYTSYYPWYTDLFFVTDKKINFDSITIDVNGTVYTLTRGTASSHVSIKQRIFSSEGTYKIKILSIE